MIYQIVLACYNCSFEDTNLGWIRTSFFLNIPFVLTVCIYIIENIKTKKIPSLTHFRTTVVIYSLLFFLYLVDLGIYFEVDELKMIRKALGNATMRSSTNYYENVYGLKISQYSFMFFSCLFILFSC
jgi:ABC-type sulfate transport system permease component